MWENEVCMREDKWACVVTAHGSGYEGKSCGWCNAVML